MFGLQSNRKLFDLTSNFFSTEFTPDYRKAKKIRILLQIAGPISSNKTNYLNMNDRIM